MPAQTQDAYGHEVRTGLAPALTAGAVSTTAAGTIAPTTNAGAAPTVTSVQADDRGGTFVLNPVTGGGAQAAGAVAVVTFANAMAQAPRVVQVNLVDTTASPIVAGTAVASSVTANGFSVTTVALTTAHNYTVTYLVRA